MTDSATGTVKERVQSVIDTIRPAVQMDGGDIELVDVDEYGTVQIKFYGACQGCPSSIMTHSLRGVLEAITAADSSSLFSYLDGHLASSIVARNCLSSSWYRPSTTTSARSWKVSGMSPS